MSAPVASRPSSATTAQAVPGSSSSDWFSTKPSPAAPPPSAGEELAADTVTPPGRFRRIAGLAAGPPPRHPPRVPA